MRFLLQKINSKIPFDFSFALQKAQEYYKWLGKERLMIKYCEMDEIRMISNPNEYIPIGSVEFVSNYLLQFYPNRANALKPLNVPEVLFPFAKREIANPNTEEDAKSFLKYDQVFAKNRHIIKDKVNGFYNPNSTEIPPINTLQISEVVPIVSEWRVFVFKNRIQYISNYSGDCLIFPDSESIKEMISAYSGQAPVAYTLDVGVSNRGTFPIEVHRFFSCGLYGYSDYKTLPKMFSQCWFEMLYSKSIGSTF